MRGVILNFIPLRGTLAEPTAFSLSLRRGLGGGGGLNAKFNFVKLRAAWLINIFPPLLEERGNYSSPSPLEGEGWGEGFNSFFIEIKKK